MLCAVQALAQAWMQRAADSSLNKERIGEVRKQGWEWERGNLLTSSNLSLRPRATVWQMALWNSMMVPYYLRPLCLIQKQDFQASRTCSKEIDEVALSAWRVNIWPCGGEMVGLGAGNWGDKDSQARV